MKDDSNPPGPGRSTADAAFNALRKEIADRNEAAHKATRKLRDAIDRRKLDEKRERDLR